MVYNERYSIHYHSKSNSGFIYIDEVDGSIASEPLVLANDGLAITTAFSDWNDPIITQTAQITILNNESDFFKLLPLLTQAERHFRMRVKQTSPTVKFLFEGFLNSDIVEQTYLHNQSIRLVASSYIKKLENDSPPILNTIKKVSLIDIISNTISMSGSDSSIYVNMTICPDTGYRSTNKSALNLAGIDTELFWKDNVNKDNGLVVLEKILKSFDSYLYWYDGKWYIERYDDLDSYPQHFVGYRMDASYGYTSTGTSYDRTDASQNIFDYDVLQKSQLLSVIPGLKKLEIKCNDVLFLNQFWPDLTNMTLQLGGWPLDRIWGYSLGKYPDYDEHIVWDTSTFGLPNGTINNAVNLQIPGEWAGRRHGEVGINNYKFESRILTTTFKVTVNPYINSNPTNLTIKFKWRPEGPRPNQDPNVIDYRIKWYLYRPDHAFQFLVRDPSGTFYIKTGTEDECYNTEIIANSDFDVKTDTIEVNLQIPLTDVIGGGAAEDQALTFALFLPTYTYGSNTLGEILCERDVFGDFTANVEKSNDTNLIVSEISNLFLNKKTIEMDLYDINNLNYKNGIYTGDLFTTRTRLWYDAYSDYLSLADRLIKNKVKLYNRSRQQISGTIDSSEYLKPFSMWYDEFQPGKYFVLTAYSFYPTRDRFECQWSEYDNTSIVNLHNAN